MQVPCVEGRIKAVVRDTMAEQVPEEVVFKGMPVVEELVVPRVKTCQRVESVAEAEGQDPEVCHTWAVGKVLTSRKQPTSMLDVEVTLMWSGPEEISLV